MYKEDINFIIKIVVLVILFATLLCWIVVSLTKNAEDNLYNNGHCNQCYVGNYVYETSVGNRYGATHIYKCDNCDHRIELDELR